MSTTLRSETRRTTGGTAGAGSRPGQFRSAATAVGRAVNRWLLPLGAAVAVIGIWQWATWYTEVRSFFLPSPLDIWEQLRWFAPNLWESTLETLYEAGLGFLIGAGGGLVMAALLASSSLLERATLPLVIALNAIPKVALVPLLVIWIGTGPGPNITLAALICFFPIMIAAMAGLMSTPADLGELARSLSASWWQTFVKIRVPAALPQVFVGLKLGITLAVIGTVVAEIARPERGLGGTIFKATQATNTSLVFAAITLLMIINLVLFYSVVVVERLALPWARETTAARA